MSWYLALWNYRKKWINSRTAQQLWFILARWFRLDMEFIVTHRFCVWTFLHLHRSLSFPGSLYWILLFSTILSLKKVQLKVLTVLFLQLGNSRRWLASARCMMHNMNHTVVTIMVWRFLHKDGHLVDSLNLQWPSSNSFHLTDTELLVKSSKVHCWKFAYQLSVFVAYIEPDYRVWLEFDASYCTLITESGWIRIYWASVPPHYPWIALFLWYDQWFLSL